MGVSLAGSGNEVVAAGAVARAFVEVLHDNRLVAGESTLEEYNRLVWLQKLHHFPRFCGDQILDRVANISPVVEMPLPLHDDYGSDHKWTKKNIFWDLPYWSMLLIRHKLDVMHIEKNVFDNIFNTIMDIKRKMNDNMNARRDLKIICTRLELDERRPSVMPKAVYTLAKE
ncbi:UNVERIFIED_CONTAM: hypothetical protein Scaly_0868600 [Sesamum calycinum]|uniref:Uncharacterized protein n=1 Tax=Sesamum calycinum TaxID=2727403 RepID=A0AAW2QV00_9LAMI